MLTEWLHSVLARFGLEVPLAAVALLVAAHYAFKGKKHASRVGNAVSYGVVTLLALGVLLLLGIIPGIRWGRAIELLAQAWSWAAPFLKDVANGGI